ncbi:M13 family metallopeptidase [Pacificimonas flava]|uniref:Peptidase, M13 family n=1 Tax=Pacificimonas flava TaxID=1234595 RepID=M2U174_9SPHN|nr:Peptidase, M13 family [Pacificimonas flava]MBB5279317.1 putative endopeptidase [Pacificimonas flava]
MTRTIPFLLAASMLSACATTGAPVEDTGSGTMEQADTAPSQATTGPELGTFGFDTAGMDKSVQPAENYYTYANGNWMKTTEIPSDKSNYGMFTRLAELSQTRVHEILEEAQTDPSSKIGRAFRSFMDESAIEAAGMTPLAPWLGEIAAIQDKAAYAALVGKGERYNVIGPVGTYVDQDSKAPTQYALTLVQAGLGLPDRDYYLKADDADLTEAREAYRAHLARMFQLAGMDNPAARADAVLAFETKLAEAHWTRVDSRDADKTYNKVALADFDGRTSGFDYSAYLEAYGAAPAEVIVAQPSALEGTAQVIADTPLDVLKDHLVARTFESYAPYLSQPFVDANFDFYQRTLSGTPENEERWKRGADFVSNILGEAVGQVYVDRYFPPETKAAADELVGNVIAAMDRRIQGLEWMAPETKQRARAKLAAFTPKIGYPDEWRDYSALRIEANDLVGNAMRAAEFENQRRLDKLGGPIDRGEWFMTPMTINAYANFSMNEIVFPAAILQPPFFDPNADPAVNYGGIGAVIGHEISHHFDDQGRKFDKTGALTDWWTEEDSRRFDALTDQVVAQYDAYEPLPGMNVQGQLTLGENIADLAGLTVAYDAYHHSLNGAEPEVIDGYTGDQRFYMGWAQVWRRKYREENLRQRLLTDPHSPSEQRVWVVRNLDPWYGAYDPAPGAAMYLAPESRVKIW